MCVKWRHSNFLTEDFTAEKEVCHEISIPVWMNELHSLSLHGTNIFDYPPPDEGEKLFR